MKTLALVALIALALPLATPAQAQVGVTLDPATVNLGFMNVYNLPAPDGDGAFQFASPWGFADLVGVYSGNQLTFSPNTIGDPDPYWYIGGGAPGAPGNKIMEANGYAEVLDGSLAGTEVTFAFEVLSNTLTPAHTMRALIRDFAPDFSSVVESSVVITTPGSYQISLNTSAAPGRPVQYGFQMLGVNVWVTDVAQFGSVVIAPLQPVANEASSFGAVKSLFQD